MSVPLILYHANCNDGFCAAWLFHRVWPNAEFKPVNYGEDPPIDFCGREVYILDFSFPRQTMLDIIGQSKSVVVLDHHKTAAKELEGIQADNAKIVFDMTKSGGRLAWEYLCSEDMARGVLSGAADKAPWLVDYTEDRDLWRWKLLASKALNATLSSYPRDFEIWDILNSQPEPWNSVLVKEGYAILRYQDQVIDSQCANAVEIELDGYKVLSVNATVLISEIAGKLAENRPFGVTWFQRSDGKKIWSLRSRDGGIDVSVIAKAHGGGGHPQAAGFQE